MAFVITTEVRTDWLLGLRNLRKNLDQATEGAEGYFLKSSLKNELELQKYTFLYSFVFLKFLLVASLVKKKKKKAITSHSFPVSHSLRWASSTSLS